MQVMLAKTMAKSKSTTRQRILQAALDLFATQGITATTTRQIAERSEVNEVTLFRNFGSKHGLLLTVLREADVLTQLGHSLSHQAEQAESFEAALQVYAEGYMAAMEGIQEFARSLVGEAGQYPPENRQAIADGLAQIHRFTEQYLVTVMTRQGITSTLPTATLASVLNTLLLGYALIELTTEFQDLWPSQAAFIQTVIDLLDGICKSSAQALPVAPAASVEPVQDLPGSLVRTILQTTRKAGLQDYAIAYVLFGAGLSPQELVSLQRFHSIADSQQHVLQISLSSRQAPLNQWIMGYRYGSYTKNPLTQWLKSRKDNESAMFINDLGQPMSEVNLRLRWQSLTADILTPAGQPPDIAQAQHTWCVEMLMRGIDPQALSLLTGWSPEQLAPYEQQAQTRLALDQALRLDQAAERS
ncbi:TetR family transcriptional regulator [bacterium]|nr:TetR family transcriptional regulator [bacterium]